MWNRFVDWIIARARRNPYTHLRDYMERYWLIHYDRCFGYGLRVHHIKQSDDRHFHDHPWNYCSLILRGGYYEVTPVFDRSGLFQGEKRRWHGPGSVLLRRSSSWHRLELPEGQTVWTLFCTGRYHRHWGFLVEPRHKVSWREHQSQQGDEFAES